MLSLPLDLEVNSVLRTERSEEYVGSSLALSQNFYASYFKYRGNHNKTPAKHRDIFRYEKCNAPARLEPMTSCLTGRRTANCATVTTLLFY